MASASKKIATLFLISANDIVVNLAGLAARQPEAI
jgi:hypothetical protein